MTGRHARLSKLEARAMRPGVCAAGPTAIVTAGATAATMDAGRCPRCGGVHVLEVIEEVVGATESEGGRA